MSSKEKIRTRLLLGAMLVASTLVAAVGAEVVFRQVERSRIEGQLEAVDALLERRASFEPRSLRPGLQNLGVARQLMLRAFHKLKLGYRPYVERRRLPNQAVGGTSINSLGYRGPEFSVEKPAGTYRVLMYGGSFVWGSGADDDEETIPAHLERQLAELGREVEVINAGETGWVITQELVAFITEGILLDPDLVIFLDGFNDAFAVASDLPAGYPLHYKALQDFLVRRNRRRPASTEQYQLNLKEGLEAQSKLWPPRTWEAAAQLLEEAEGGMGSSFVEAAVAHGHAASMAKAVAEARGIEVVFAAQPAPFYCKPLTEFEEQVANDQSSQFLQEFRWLRDHYGDYMAALRGIMEEEGLALIDLSCIFEDDREARYIDYAHLSGDGYEIVARELAHRVFDYSKVGGGGGKSPTTSAARPPGSTPAPGG